MNDDFIGLNKQSLNVPKKLDHRSPQYKFREKQVLKPSADCYIFLLSETKIDDSFSDFHFFAEGFKMYHKDRTKNEAELFFCVNENLHSRKILILILFEFSISNKKWLPLKNCKPSLQNNLLFINELNLALNFSSRMYKLCFVW